MRYNFHNMTCTDPDTLQFAQEQSEECWYYVQVRDDDVLERFCGHASEFIEAYEQNAEFAQLIDCHTGMYAGDVDLADYTDEEIEDHIKPYGYTLKEGDKDSVKKMYGNSWKQICCECIFEQLMCTDYRLDC